jgi:DNA replicative helicase MCM subunit Mcm2 (Cdc46/Mcm family)
MSNPQYDRETCYFCHEPDTHLLETHHIVPERYGGSDDADNLVRLCPNCHERLEQVYDQRFYAELGAKKPAPTIERQKPTLEEITDIRHVINANQDHEHGVSISEVYNKAEGIGMHPQRTKATIDHLETQGDIYEPEIGHLRTV